MPSRAIKYLLTVPILYLLFFFALGHVGLLGPDEPRYAAIGREMALSGDWITPRLWGAPWFEKPALLYWLTGLAFRAGIDPDLAPRLPVAVIGVAFLIFYFLILRREFGERAAWLATAILGSSAAWLGFSAIAVTDLPMSAAFSAAMLLWLRCGDRPARSARIWAGVLLGFAVLAKGLVPLVLALPALWITRKHLWSLIACAAVALPWYLLCTLHNGTAFLADFFWKHHFERFTSGALMHQQPFWYYVPILLAGLFPWTPLVALLFGRKLYTDPRRRFLLLWFAFGFVFFSVATNKLPGYLLPLFPAIAALLGLSLAEVNWARWLLPCCALLLTVVPVVSGVLPQVLLHGLGALSGYYAGWAPLVVLALAVLVALIKQREAAVTLLVLAVTAGVVIVKVRTYPVLDETVSARQLWRRVSTAHPRVCVEDLSRNWRYGLNYYSITPLPDCEKEPQWFHITPRMTSQAESRSLPAEAAESARP